MNSNKRPSAPSDAPRMAEHVLATPYTMVLGYHEARAEACRTVAWFANYWESQEVDWKIIVMAGSFHVALRNFGEITSLVKFPITNGGRSFVQSRHGTARAIGTNINHIRGMMADRILWFLDEGIPEDIWHYVAASVGSLKDSHPEVERLIAVNPLPEIMFLFEYEE